MLKVGIAPQEIVFPGRPITLISDYPLDLRSVAASVLVKGVRGRVTLSPDQRTATWNPPQDFAPGAYTLLIGEITTTNGKPVAGSAVIPFFMTDSVARIPAGLRVESMVRLRINQEETTRLSIHRSPGGQFIEVMKATDSKTGAPKELAFDQDGNPVDAKKVFADAATATVRKYGKLQPALYRMCEHAKAGDRIDVAIWFRTDDPDHDRLKKLRDLPRILPKEVAEFHSRLLDESGRLVEKLATRFQIERPRPDRAGPVLYARMTSAQIREAAVMPEIAAIYLYEPKGILDLSDSLAIANSDDVHALGTKGAGVNVAVWEPGPDDKSDLVIAGFYDPAESDTSKHARHTCGIVKNKEANKPHGHAPDCTLYSANSYDTNALSWAVKDRTCTVISQSFHRDSEETSGGLSSDDVLKDWLVLHYPYPTILEAAGNISVADEFVNHKGYNSLAVGNHNDAASSMAGDSCTRNPTTAHADRELPEICANGTVVTCVKLTMSGTSMAAPATAGIAAMLQSRKTTLKTWPEGCRALLLAGANKNVTGGTWWQDLITNADAADGAGAADALESLRIADSRKSRNNAASQRGWDIGTLASSDFDAGGMSNFLYKVKVPSGLFGPRHVKVALAWNSKVSSITVFGTEIPLSSHLTVDFDLKVYDSAGAQVACSNSWDNSYEIAEFQGTAGETYTIKIRRWSGSDSTWFGIAWTVTGGLVLTPIPGNLRRSRTT